MPLPKAKSKSWYEDAAVEPIAEPPVPAAAVTGAQEGGGGDTSGPPPATVEATAERNVAEAEASATSAATSLPDTDDNVVSISTRTPQMVLTVEAQQTAPAPSQALLADHPAGVRRVVSSKRGKRDFNYSWPTEDLTVMRKAFHQYAPLYRRYWVSHDPGGNYRLTFSPFVARALEEAFKNPSSWLSTVRNDARKEPVVGGREQVGLVWPAAVEEQVVDLWETLDRDQFPAGFLLTKQHLAAAAILHGLRTVEDWYLTVANDDRFSVPVESDGRLRQNKPSQQEPSPSHGQG